LSVPLSFDLTTFDVRGRLPVGWQQDVATAAVEADFRDFPRTPILSREAKDVVRISRGRVHASQVRQRLPWLYQLYHGYFLELASETSAERVVPALDDRYGVVLNVQRGTAMRFECHVDSNPLTGILFCTDHPAGTGGELVFAHAHGASDIETVEKDCSVLRPRAGRLIFFDGTKYPHYARPLLSEPQMRIVAVMNFYTESYPESTRPPELNRHLFGPTLRREPCRSGTAGAVPELQREAAAHGLRLSPRLAGGAG
jgi:hypothetical protein